MDTKTQERVGITEAPWGPRPDVQESGPYRYWSHVYGAPGSGAWGDSAEDGEALLVAIVQTLEDARAIAAVPKMLAALEALSAWCAAEDGHEGDWSHRMGLWEKARDLSRDALAAARGEP